MKIILESRITLSGLLVFFSLFLIAFRMIVPSVFLSFVSSAYLLWELEKQKAHILALISICLFYLVYLIFGVDNFEKGLGTFLNLVIIFFVPSVLFFILGLTDKLKNNIILIYSIFTLLYCYIIAVTSISFGFVGYGDLYNPFSEEIARSPLYAMLIVISSISILENLKDGVLVKFAVYISAFYFSSIYMASRASAILMLLYLSYILYREMRKQTFIVNLIFVLFLLFICFGTVYFYFDDISLLLSDSRFSKGGLQSGRFALWQAGLENMFLYPFGGMLTSRLDIYTDTTWYHNVFLDIVRVSGYIVMLFWVALNVFLIYMFVSNKKQCHKIYFPEYIALSLIISQDLAFDGFYNLMVYWFYIFGSNLKVYINGRSF